MQDDRYQAWLTQRKSRHTFREIMFCLEGTALQHVAGTTYRCTPGTALLIDEGEIHADGYPADQRAFTHLWIMELGTRSAIANIYHQSNRHGEQQEVPIVLTQAEFDPVIRCWDAVKAPSAWMTPGICRTALLAAVFTLVFRVLDAWNKAETNHQGEERHRAMISNAQAYAAEHLDSANSLKAIAHLAGYSQYHFSRLFRQYSGQTIHDFVTSCRQKQARELLNQGMLSKQIASKLGFSSPSAFSNWLKRNRLTGHR